MGLFLEILEYQETRADEISHRIPERGSAEFKLGGQCIVRENQVAVFCTGGKVYDATVGPAGETAEPTIASSRNNYKSVACDVSNTGGANMHWRDDEAVPAKAPGHWPIIPNEPWLEAGYTDTDYTIEVSNADFSRVEARNLNIK